MTREVQTMYVAVASPEAQAARVARLKELEEKRRESDDRLCTEREARIKAEDELENERKLLKKR